MKKCLFASDIVILTYIAIISSLVLIFRSNIPNWFIYIIYHLSIIAMISLIIYAYNKYDSRIWQVARYWYPVIVILSAFRELHHLIPCINPFEPGYYNDKILYYIDQRLFSGITGITESMASSTLSDILMICYLSYFAMPILLGIALYIKGEHTKFKNALCGLLIGWFISYIGYIIVPAVGPHVAIDTSRATVLDGEFIAKSIYHGLIRLELRMADAFPSGHTLIAILVLYYSWKYYRNVFWGILPFAIGLVISTIYLRYHYVVDLAVAIMLVPPTIWLERFASKLLPDK
ncbi:MAG: hypothetical protein A2W05_04285 [Candidatus Schekmanbacteria bacterium RBG_16_38_10]|uniref:Phosphatidic acid phosphatase type 2/haloperoxidase domain-containing protein n=1 Tax=Candidatus Schekmanbacteria bacterium RBG_16_38_10 TaxID=1817879 RepID=A0A1F7S0P5_9BACT|nr:MAG: hypothetical protein A2W05_04285 [Candidatus Schekmanbacteria bacterium RBG_16_38_10]